MFEIIYDDGRRRTGGRQLDGYTISSPCEPNGSGELIIISQQLLMLERLTGYQINQKTCHVYMMVRYASYLNVEYS